MEGIDQVGASGLPYHLQEKKAKKSDKKKGIFKSTFDREVKQSQDSGLEVVSPGNLAEIESILDEVHQLGEALSAEPTMTNIKKYKQGISRFLKTINLHNFQVEEQEGILNRNFSRKKYYQVKVLNEKLDRLVAGVLQNQTAQLEILRRVEEIQGLLVDLLS